MSGVWIITILQLDCSGVISMMSANSTESLKFFLIKRAKYISHFNKLTKVSDQEVMEIHGFSRDDVEITIPFPTESKHEKDSNSDLSLNGTISFDMAAEDQRDFSVWLDSIANEQVRLSETGDIGL